MVRYGVVYLITCLVNGKQYVGQTVAEDPEQRFRNHVNGAVKSNTIFGRAIYKYGAEAFKFTVICVSFTKGALDLAEDEAIVNFNTLHPNGYNLKGGPGRGRYSEDLKRRLSIKQSEVMNRPGERHRRGALVSAALRSDSKRLAKRNANIKAALNRPEVREQRRQALITAYSKVDVQQRHRSANKVAAVQPERIAKIGMAAKRLMRDKVYKERCVATMLSEEVTAKRVENLKHRFNDSVWIEKWTSSRNAVIAGGRWINDGTKARRIKSGDLVSDGWQYGMLRK